MVGIIGDQPGNYGKMENIGWEGRGVVRSDIRSFMVVAPACIDSGPHQLGPNEQAFEMY
jgi:hypothetical protein